jgi:tetrahydrodipicolinate N-succinyltransferase
MFNRMRNFLFTWVGLYLAKVNSRIEDRSLPCFGNQPKKLKIRLPRLIANPEKIFLGDNVNLGQGCCLLAFKEHLNQNFDPVIKIGNNVSATANLQISALQSVVIEDDVMFASNIFVGDHMHGYKNANIPYKDQPCRVSPITIKKGCWIGQNVIVMPGVTIGGFSIIGANSVVTRDIPEQSIAFGAPARVVKKWDKAIDAWLEVQDK